MYMQQHRTQLLYEGEELEAFIARTGRKFDRVVYIGDGSNDFCPILRMGRFVAPNKNPCSSIHTILPAPILHMSDGTEGSKRASRGRVIRAVLKLSSNLGREHGRLRNTSKCLPPTDNLKRYQLNQPSTPVFGNVTVQSSALCGTVVIRSWATGAPCIIMHKAP